MRHDLRRAEQCHDPHNLFLTGKYEIHGLIVHSRDAIFIEQIIGKPSNAFDAFNYIEEEYQPRNQTNDINDYSRGDFYATSGIFKNFLCTIKASTPA